MRAAGRVTAVVGAVVVVAAVMPATSAQAAPRPPVNNVITAKQFPWFKVTEKPAVQEREKPSSEPCAVNTPEDSVAVGTTLTREIKVNSRTTRSLGLDQQLLRLRTWQDAHVYFAKARAVLGVPSCASGTENGLTSTTTVLPAAAAGSDEGFTALTTITGGDGDTLKLRLYIHRAGRDIILISPSSTVLTKSGDDIDARFEDNAATRNLGRQGVAAALARLGR